MNKIAGVHTHDGIDVKYLFRAGQKDSRHLIVIFSGFRKLGTVDFAGASTNNLRANILWIIDEFDGHFSYYVKAFGGRDITHSIASLIESFRTELALTRSQVTIAGFSKGGSAAIFHGIKLGFKNIVTTVPQPDIGSYVASDHPRELASMGGIDEIPTLDHLIPDAIMGDTDTNRNIFLFTSPEDVQYSPRALPLSRLLDKYQNFNLIVTSSPYVQEHVHVTQYNVPLILSLLAILSEGIVPELKKAGCTDRELQQKQEEFWHQTRELQEFNNVVVNGSGVEESPWPKRQVRHQLLAAITEVKLESGVLHFSGYSVIKGVPITGYGQISTTLKASSGDDRFEVKLGSTVQADLSTRLFDSGLTDYTFGGITTIARAGLPLGAWPLGKYKMGISSTQNRNTYELKSLPVKAHSQWNLLRDKIVGTRQNHGSWECLILPAIGRRPEGHFTEEIRCELIDNLLFLEGYFIPIGRDLALYNDIRFSLSIVRQGSGDPLKRIEDSMPIAVGSKTDASVRSGEPWRNQSKGYYTTVGYAGLSLPALPTGVYELYVTSRIGDDVVSLRLLHKLKVDVAGKWLELITSE